MGEGFYDQLHFLIMPQEWNSGASSFILCVCLSVCLWMCLLACVTVVKKKPLTLVITFEL